MQCTGCCLWVWLLLLSRTEGPILSALFWYSLNVSPACPRGRYGLQCRSTCSCQNGALCDPADGSCKCGLGWTGPRCDAGTTTKCWYSVHGKPSATTNNQTAVGNSSKNNGVVSCYQIIRFNGQILKTPVLYLSYNKWYNNKQSSNITHQ